MPTQLSPIQINSTARGGVISCEYSAGRGILAPMHDGLVTRTLAKVITGEPSLAITTANVGEWLGILAASASSQIPYLTLTGVTWIDRTLSANAPTDAAGSVHEQGTASSGTLCMTSLSAPANQSATLSLVAMIKSADGTDPVTFSQVAAPSAGTVMAGWVLDSCTMDGTLVDYVDAVTVTPEITWEIQRGPKPFPIFVRPHRVDWSMAVTHRNLELQRTKGDKSATGSVVLKNLATGGPTRGSSTVTFSLTGLLHHGGSSRGADSSATCTTTLRAAGTAPATWAIA
jgi:hypothetical protein